MKDAEARRVAAAAADAVEELKDLIAELPDAVSQLVIKHYGTKFDDVDDTLERMRDAAEAMNGLGEVVQKMGEVLNDHTRDLERIDRDVNDVRVDVSTLLDTQAELAGQVRSVNQLLQGFATQAANVTKT